MPKQLKNHYNSKAILPTILRFPKKAEKFPSLFIIKTIIVLIPILIFLWILNQNLFITKTLSYHFQPNRVNQIINISNRADLVGSFGSNNTLEWRLNDEKLNFNIKIPRSFASATVTVDLSDKSQDVVMLSAQAPPNVSVKPFLANIQFLNTLPWNSISDGTWTLWQRHIDGEIQNKITVKQFTSVKQFLTDPPPSERIGVVNVNPETLLSIPNYRPSTEPMTFVHSFRGTHTLSLYAQDEPLMISFKKIDLNRAAGPDTLSYKLSSQGKILLENTIPDDGVTEKNRPAGTPQSVIIRVPNVAKGIYQLELEASDDILIRDITTTQHYVTFQDHIFLADGPSYQSDSTFQPVRLSMLSGNVSIQTPHTDGLQTVTIGSNRVKLTALKHPVVQQVTDNTMLLIPRGDIFVTGRDIVLDSAKQFYTFMPTGLPLTGSPSLNGIDYVWAPYQPRETFGRLLVTKTFPFSDLFVKSKTLFFSLQAPGLPEHRGQLIVNKIDVKLTRGPLPWDTGFHKIKKLLHI